MDPNIPTQSVQSEASVPQSVQDFSSFDQQAAAITPATPPKSRKKIISIVLLIIIAISALVTVYVLRQQQETRSRASTVIPENTIIAVVNSENVTKGDLRKIAEEQYKSSAVDDNALKAALDVMVERKALEIEVKNGNISATNDEVAKLMKDEGINQQSAYFRILVNKATLRYTKARKALTIDFWLPPPEELATYEEVDKAENAKKLSDGFLALDEAKTRMQAGEDILKIVQSLSTKYPSIAPILAINGYILIDSQANLESISQPKTYGFEDKEPTTAFSTALFADALKIGDVQEVLEEDEMGATVFKLLEKNDNPQYATYQDWLKAKKTDLLIIKNPLL